jgi:phosphohistidine phosphatase
MTTLFLLRHARAGWPEPGMRDFDRPLDDTGKADAAAIGGIIRIFGYVPDLILCSAARRARETFDGAFGHARGDYGHVSFLDSLYGEDAAGYLAIVQEFGGDMESLMLIGHNPMTEDLATAISGNGSDEARAAMIGGFPTSALAVIRFDGSLAEAAPGKGYLEAFVLPSDYLGLSFRSA